MSAVKRATLAYALVLSPLACGAPGDASSETDVGSSSEASDTTAGEPSGTTASSSTTDPASESSSSGGEPSSSSGEADCESPRACADQAETRAAAALEMVRDDDAALLDFLVRMPLGGDLHHHLSGSVYAEAYLGWADADGDFCIQEGNLALSLSCGDGNDVPIPTGKRELYLDVVRAWSMLDFVPSPQESGADHFFATFSKFGAISGSQHGRMLADVRRRAASENVLYIEPMLLSNSTARSLGEDVWQDLGGGSLTPSDYASFHAAMLADSGFDAARDRITDDVDISEFIADAEQSCDDLDANPACEVETAYQTYISRSGSDSGVFGQMIAAYEAAIVEPRMVGLNLVGPEDGSTAMANYDDQMQMLEYLEGYYADSSPLRLSLHAGEITAASIPDGYALDEEDHIRKAVQLANARRVGHGVDVLHESDPSGLLELLRERDVLVELCFASNDIILELSGDAHPVRAYLDAQVPVSIATDDQGVARSSLAAEFVRAVRDQGLDYYELKRMVRASLHYSFLPGDAFYIDVAAVQVADGCAPEPGNTPVTQPPSGSCQALLDGSDRARLQRRLEVALESFESEF